MAHVAARNRHLATCHISLEIDDFLDIKIGDLWAVNRHLVVLVCLESIRFFIQTLHLAGVAFPDMLAAVLQPPLGEGFGIIRASFSHGNHGHGSCLIRNEAESC